MYEDIPFQELNCEGKPMDEMLETIYEIYSPEKENQCGTLAITISLCC